MNKIYSDIAVFEELITEDIPFEDEMPEIVKLPLKKRLEENIALFEKGMTEDTLVRLPIQKILETKGIWYYHIPNSQHLQKYRAKASKKYKGFPDLIIFLAGKCWLVECKKKGGKMSTRQIECKKHFESIGYDYSIIDDIDTFVVELIKRIF